jgi:hypothetical protein
MYYLKQFMMTQIKRSLLFSFMLMCGTLFAMARPVTFKSAELQLTVGDNGYISSILIGHTEILSKKSSPLLVALSNKSVIAPKKMLQKGNILKMVMSDNKEIDLLMTQTAHCVTLEVTAVPAAYDAVVFGPVAVNINDVVGDVIGVVQGKGVALGMQALNIKTTIGVPPEYADAVEKTFDYSGTNAETSTGNIPDYRLAAVKVNDGSVLQFCCRNRSKLAYRKVQQLDNAMVLPVEGSDGIIKGTKVAIFGCKAADALDRIGKIEVEQHLPHPMLNGEWAKTSRAAMRSYLITNFSESDLDFVLDKAEKAGFRYVYEMDAFGDWGHFNWDKGFVNGDDAAVRKLVDKAGARGISIGVHTLSNFITPNDAYVTPVPSQHLLKQGILQLVSDIDAQQNVIRIKKSGLFAVPMTLNALMIDNELISFGSCKEEGDEMVLSGCRRGAFKTTAAAHSKKMPLYKLWDYPYKTFFPDLTVQDKMADRLAEAFNNTGIGQTSFDGLEGCTYTGQEDYSTARFVDRFYRGLKRGDIINDASNLTHYNWHIHSRMNWGEPWGEAMRAGQVANRIKNQAFFRRNLFPRMLGWFLIRLADKKFECSSLEDLEWALAKSAGFDAGYGMTIDLTTMRKHGEIDRLLEAIKQWDILREANCFPEDLREKMRDPMTEWHLEKNSATDYTVYPLVISKSQHCSLSELQPGQPGGAEWSLDAPLTASNSLYLRVEGDGSISNPRFVTSKGTVVYPCRIEGGQYLRVDNDGTARITDKNFNKLSSVTGEGNLSSFAGETHVSFSCDKSANEAPDITVRFISRSAGIPLKLQKK